MVVRKEVVVTHSMEKKWYINIVSHFDSDTSEEANEGL